MRNWFLGISIVAIAVCGTLTLARGVDWAALVPPSTLQEASFDAAVPASCSESTKIVDSAFAPPSYVPPAYIPGGGPYVPESVAQPLDAYVAPTPSDVPPPGAFSDFPFTQNPGGNSYLSGAEQPLPGTPTDLDIVLQEAQTGRLMIGAGVNSDHGLGGVMIDERNMEWTRLREPGGPTGLEMVWEKMEKVLPLKWIAGLVFDLQR